jgi:hypothetical protein
VSVDFSLIPPTLTASIQVHESLEFTAFHHGILVPTNQLCDVMQYPKAIQHFSDLLNLMAHLNSKLQRPSPIKTAIHILENYVEMNSEVLDDTKRRLPFLIEQLQLISASMPNSRRYSMYTLSLAILWHHHGPACYRAILADNLLILPSVRTIQRVTGSLSLESESDMLLYLKARRAALNQFEAYVSLIYDEIYVFETLDYCNGRFIGMAEDGKAKTTTMLCFMIHSLSSPYCDIIAMIPLHGISIASLEKYFHNALKLATTAGFKVRVAISDNHPVNRKLFITLGKGTLTERVSHPAEPNQPLFLLLDPVHNIKNIYNNFQRRGIFHLPPFHPNESPFVANFAHIKQLYAHESGMELRIARKVSPTLLNPTNIQRASAQLGMSLFHESTVNALEYYTTHSGKPWRGTHT